MTEDYFVFDIIHYKQGCICVKCKEKYKPYNDPFIEIINYGKIITFELCEKCVKFYYNVCCSKCGKILNEPWNKIYVDNNIIKCHDCK